MIRSTIAALCSLALSLTLVACSDAAEVPDGNNEPGPAPQYVPPPPSPCGSATDYLNVPMTLNDGSGVYVPFGGTVPAGSGVTVPILLPVGATLTSLTVRIDPGTHTSLNGEMLPTLELHKVGSDGIETTVGAIAWDPYAVPYSTWDPGATVAANFSTPHNIVLPLGVTITDAFYFLTISQEWGGGQAQPGVFCGTKMVYSPSGT